MDGAVFLYLSSVYPFTIIAMVWLENGCFGLQIEVFKSSMHKNICPIPSSFFLGFFPSIQFFPVAVCSFFGCVYGVTLIEVKWYLFFSGRTRKNFLYEVHTKGYRLTDFLSEGKMRKSSEMYPLCLYAFNTVFCGTFEIRPFWHWISIIFALCGTNIVRYTVFFIISYSQHIFRPFTLSYTISREIKKQIY